MEKQKSATPGKKKTIVLTGGGSTGHVTLNLSLIPLFRKDGWDIHYIGSKTGIEQQLLGDVSGVTYHSISTGKLRRYFDAKNISDIFRILSGCVEARRLIKKIRPDVIFSKGGYVSFPVVYAGAKNHIPVITHESDYTPGLANRLAERYADTICLTFEETRKYVSDKIQAIYVGPIVRPDIYSGSREKGLLHCGFEGCRPTVLVVGGSLGAKHVNEAVRANLDLLLERFRIIHICGKGHVDPDFQRPGYRQFEYVRKEFPDVLAAADVVVSRAGSNAIFELLAACKPMLLIPLPTGSSRGDQIENAESFEKQGFARVLPDSDCSGRLCENLGYLYDHREEYIKAMQSRGINRNALNELFEIIAGKAL